MNNHENFQNIILKIATELININVEDFDQKIQDALTLVGAFLDVDRVYVFEYNHKNKVMNNTFEWCNVHVSKQIDILQNINMDMFDKIWVRPHLEGKPVIYEQVSKLQKGNVLYDILEPQGIKSITTLPLMNQNKCLGFVGFDDVRVERKWKDLEMNLLKILAEVITNGLLKQEHEKMLLELKEKADDASNEKNQFLAKISHEFRTPLHGITNALYLLESTHLSVEQKEYFDIAQFSTESLMNMINDILDISKIESGQIDIHQDIFDLENELVNIMLTEQNHALEKGLILQFNYDYQIKNNLIGDYAKIRQILLNLLNNAIKYTQKGDITLSVDLINDSKNDATIKFSIKDTGIGMENEYQKKIFDKFFQIDQGDSRKYEGTGLGLSIVKQLVQKLGSDIEVESKINEGTTFSFKLKFKKHVVYDFKDVLNLKALFIDQTPYITYLKEMLTSMGMVVDVDFTKTDQTYDLIIFSQEKSLEVIDFYKTNYGHQTTAMVALGDISQIHYKNIDIYFNHMISRRMIYQKIISNIYDKKQKKEEQYHKTLSGYALIVDDNRLNRIALENILKKQGLKSKLVDSGLKAIEAAKNERFDIILMDIQMPDMDGIQASKKIRLLGPQYKYIPIIAVTANAYLNDYDLLKHAEMNDVLFKPIHIEALERILRKHLSYQKQIFVPAIHKVFDKNDYEFRFEDSDDIAKNVIEIFLDTYHEDLLKIKDAISSKDFQNIKETLHYFKGSCSYLSGKRTTWLLTSMMELNEQKKLEDLDNAYEVLAYEVDKLVEAIKAYLKEL